MTATLDDLRRSLAERAATTPLDGAAARARLDALLAETSAPVVVVAAPVATPTRRRPRRLAVAVVAAAVVALVASVVALTAGSSRPDNRGPALGSDDALALTRWLFTVQPARLPEHLSVVQYVHADSERQVAAVLSPQDAATSNHYSAVVELASDPAALGVATQPADARPVGPDAWTSPQTEQEFGVSGVQLVWRTPSGYTIRVVAGDGVAAQTVRDATDVDGWGHPVRFPVEVAADWFPAGSRVASYDFVGVQGVTAVVDVPGQPALALALAGSGVFVANRQPGVVAVPFAGGFSAIGSDEPNVQAFTSSVVDVSVAPAHWSADIPALPTNRLRDMLTGSHFVGIADQQAWFPLVDALPTG